MEKDINDKYNMWRKYSPFLYDFIYTHALTWPSLTIEWRYCEMNTESSSLYELVFATQTAGNTQNSLYIAEVTLPYINYNEIDGIDLENTINEVNVRIKKELRSRCEIHRARALPSMPHLIATKSPQPFVTLYDIQNDITDNDNGKEIVDSALLWMSGHSKGGWALRWNPTLKGHLISGSDDQLICYYDIQSTSQNSTIEPLATFSGHKDIVEDIDWLHSNSFLFLSVSDDNLCYSWDTRQKNATSRIIAHSAEVYGVSFCHQQDMIFATCSGDHLVKIWDFRNHNKPLYTLQHHKNEVYQTSFNPLCPNILASSGSDNQILIWDLNKIGQEQSQEDKIDGPSELLFKHCGHTKTVSDISWHPTLPWVIASTSEDNVINIWEMAHYLHSQSE